jgi:putative phosphoesterase
MKIGVISDTHNFFDPKVAELFAGVDHILHAGDIGQTAIISQLEQIAPVTAVLGNTDSFFLPFSDTAVVELNEQKFLLHHIVNPRELVEPIRTRIARERPDVVVFGHTHKPFCQMFSGRLYFNPGYAGKPRPGAERSIAVLGWDHGTIRPEFLSL